MQDWKAPEQEWKAPVPNGNAFWEAQQWNKDNGVLPKKEDWAEDQDDHRLFQERLGSSGGIDFDKYDSVPVDVSGSKSELIPMLGTFQEIYTSFLETAEDSKNRRFDMRNRPSESLAVSGNGRRFLERASGCGSLWH